MVFLEKVIEDNGKYSKFKLNIEAINQDLEKPDPNKVVEGSKALIEAVCKTISNDLGVQTDESWGLPRLVKETLSSIPFIKNMKKNDADRTKIICGSIITLASTISEFRNVYGEISHGRDASEAKKCDEIISRLIYYSADLICSFSIEAHTKFSTLKDLKRVEYEKYSAFNEWFDEENGYVNLGKFKFSASQVLYNQDLEAYIETLNDYLEMVKDSKTQISDEKCNT